MIYNSKRKSSIYLVGEKRHGEEFSWRFCFLLICMEIFSSKGDLGAVQRTLEA